MPSTPKGLSDEKAARVLVAFREGRTLRQFAMRAGRFDAYCKAHPEYAREALPLLEANRKAGDIRDDIVQSIFVAMLEGSLRRDDVRYRVQEFVAVHNRDANKHGTGKYGLRSIDAPAFVDSSTTFGDTISRGLWD
jgi:hypothetical protein